MLGMVLRTEQGLHPGLLSESTTVQPHPQIGAFRVMSSPGCISYPVPLACFDSSFQPPLLVLQALGGMNVLTFPVDSWQGRRDRVVVGGGMRAVRGLEPKAPGVRFRAQLNCPELSFLFSRKRIIQEPPTGLGLAALLSRPGMCRLSR